jgi:hypothetical protein
VFTFLTFGARVKQSDSGAIAWKCVRPRVTWLSERAIANGMKTYSHNKQN